MKLQELRDLAESLPSVRHNPSAITEISRQLVRLIDAAEPICTCRHDSGGSSKCDIHLSDETLRALWREVHGPKAELTGPLIRFAAAVAGIVWRRKPIATAALLIRAPEHQRGDSEWLGFETCSHPDCELVRAALVAGPAAREERVFEAVVHTYEGDDHLVPSDLREASFVKRARRFREGLVAGPAVPPPWQPIESAPKDGREILAYGLLKHIDVVHWARDEEPAWTDGEYTYSPTHWMPLPDPPVVVIKEKK